MRVQRFAQVVLVGGLSFAATTSFQRALRAAPVRAAPTGTTSARVAATSIPAARTMPAIEAPRTVARASAACRPVRVV